MRTHQATSELLQQMITEVPTEVKMQCEMSDTIASRIESILKVKGMSQKDLALAVGRSQGEVSRWLCGTHNFTLATLAKISVALECNVLTAQ